MRKNMYRTTYRVLPGILFALCGLASFLPLDASAQNTITTFAGGGSNGSSALAAQILWPAAVAIDKHGNTYVCATELDEVLKIDGLGNVTVVAGSGYAGYSGDGGAATSATLDLSGAYIGTAPGIALDASGNLFIADTVNSVIRRVDATTGIITTVAGNGPGTTGLGGYSGDGGQATSASLSFPQGMALDSSGNLFIADGNGVIRRVDAVTGIITTVAGNYTLAGTYSGDSGAATNAGLNYPNSVALDGSGNLLIPDTYNCVVRRVDASSGIITTVAGDYSIGGSYSGDSGLATNAGLTYPCCVTLDTSGDLFIGDAGNEVIRRVDATSGIITTVAGNGPAATGFGGFSGDGGSATSAQLNLFESITVPVVPATSIALDASGDLFIPDTFNNRVRRVDGKTGTITTFAGGGSGGDGGPATNGLLAFPAALAVDSSGNLFVDDMDGDRIRRVDATTEIISNVAGNGILDSDVSSGVPATSAGLNLPMALAVDSSGNLFIADWLVGRIRRVDAVTGIISTVAGGGPDGLGDGGPATSARLHQPRGVAVDAVGDLFIADSNVHRVRRVDAVTGIITTVAGNGTAGYSGDRGLATLAELNSPRGVVVDHSGNLFIADLSNYRIRRVDAISGIIITVAGNGSNTYSGDGGPATQTGLGPFRNLALDSLGNLFISGAMTERVLRVDALSGTITTVAGNGATGFSGDGGPATSAELDDPVGIAVDKFGNLFIGDSANNRVRKFPLPPFVALSPINLTLPAQLVGTTGASMPVTLTNTGTAALTITDIAASGNFGQTNTCGGSVAAGGSCTINVTFTPPQTGTLAGTLTITDNSNGVTGSTQMVSLSGTGIVPVVHWPGPIVLPPRPPGPVPGQPIRVAPPTPPVTAPISVPVPVPVPGVSLATSSLTFSAQSVGTSSHARTITLTNTGNSTLTLTGIATSANFSQTNNCGGSVAARASCTINVNFSPTAAGSHTGTLTITYNSNGAAGSTQTVTLRGTGKNPVVR
ncbi:MAG: choice-of-anchor D domain-containing protein [Terriglobia bacterium]|jgi:sugar lactone lactonase YvrE